MFTLSYKQSYTTVTRLQCHHNQTPSFSIIT